MGDEMSGAFDRLQRLLIELFQLDAAGDLDFGVYRIMNHKRSEIEAFIHESLPAIVEDALKSGAAAREAGLATELEEKAAEIRQNFGEDAISPEGELDQRWEDTPAGREYVDLRSRAAGATGQEEMKATVFNHLYTFFSRYYEGGDFLSRRRYSRRQKYAIPYNGEEVYLHWANADQYYVKTGQDFTDYHYKAPNGVAVHFKLVAASVEQNNNKGDDKYFVPRLDEAAYDPEVRALTVPFEHRPLTGKEEGAYGTKKERQKGINDEAVSGLMERFNSEPEALAAMTDVKGRDSEDRPVGYLEHHLRRYVRGNTQDFFVHKDLKGFLEGELDFYLKNEVLNIDDLDGGGEGRAEGWFEVMRAMKRIGRGIIAFLAQIEDYQKRLFEKKKFVARADYCLTLDNVPEELYPEILANDAQFAEWERLFEISSIEGTVLNGGGEVNEQWLRDNPYLVLDTKLFGEDFKDRLLGSIEDLDERTGGLLIQSENFQALNLLQDRYHEQVKCIYIDPPYNTAASEILYKNNYKHSSWLALTENRLREARTLLGAEGILCVTIDDAEFHRLYALLVRMFGGEEYVLGTAVIRSNPAGRSTVKGFQVAHEYGIFVANSEHVSVGRLPRSEKQIARYKDSDEKGAFEWVNFRKHGGADASRIARPKMFYPIYVSSEGGLRIPQLKWNESEKVWTAVEHPTPDEEVVYPVNTNEAEKRWKWGYESVLENLSDFRSGSDQTGRTGIYMKSRMKEDGALPLTWWDKKEYSATEYGTNFLARIVGNVSAFSFPKSLYATEDSLRVSNLENGDLCLDFFAGSGTTGHAVINLNREDGGRRKYILVEMGEYFDTVLKPRIQKVIYSKDWKEGRPVSREGTSHIFKYLSLEQYEDTLNNISFTHEEAGQNALELYGDDYLLRYMLDFETRGSETLLNVGAMSAPFDYKLTLHEGGETRAMPVDLPETFAYLLGLRVKSRKVYYDGERRYLVYRGATPEPERREIAAIWRDTQGWEAEDLDRDREFVQQEGLAAETDEVFVNGDSFIPEARPLEPVFKQRMLAEPASG
jgi:adenine-specific DNA-methyltransferase